MGTCNCGINGLCKTIGIIVAIIFAIVFGIAAVNGLFTVAFVALAALILGLVSLGILLFLSFFKNFAQTECLCSHLTQLLVGIIGTIILSILQLVLGLFFSATVSVIFVALTAFFAILTLATFVCLIICLTDCNCNR